MSKQGIYLNKIVDVCFNYDTSKLVRGQVVRNDIEQPHLTIIALVDGRYVLSTECQYSPLLVLERKSAQPCGCDPGENWTCELHRSA